MFFFGFINTVHLHYNIFNISKQTNKVLAKLRKYKMTRKYDLIIRTKFRKCKRINQNCFKLENFVLIP